MNNNNDEVRDQALDLVLRAIKEFAEASFTGEEVSDREVLLMAMRLWKDACPQDNLLNKLIDDVLDYEEN